MNAFGTAVILVCWWMVIGDFLLAHQHGEDRYHRWKARTGILKSMAVIACWPGLLKDW